jgi:hypothetical protein
MKSLLLPFLALAALAASGCQPPRGTAPADTARGGSEPDGLLSTDRRAYAPGEIATLRLRNIYGDDIGYNLCFSMLERREGDSWVGAEVQDERACTAELRLLPPGASDAFNGATIPAELLPGEYRFRTRVEQMRDGSEVQARSNPFEVRR